MKNSKFFEKNIALLLAVLLLGITVCSCRSETTTELPASGLPSGEKSSGAPTVPAESSSFGEIPASSEIPVSPSPAPSIEPTHSDSLSDEIIDPSDVLAVQLDINCDNLELIYGESRSKIFDSIYTNYVDKKVTPAWNIRRFDGTVSGPVVLWQLEKEKIPEWQIAKDFTYLFVYRAEGESSWHWYYCSPVGALAGGTFPDDIEKRLYSFPVFDHMNDLTAIEDEELLVEMYLFVVDERYEYGDKEIKIGEYRYSNDLLVSGGLVCWSYDSLCYDAYTATVVEEMRNGEHIS